MKIVRTKDEIMAKINEISEEDNFVSDNYGTEAADNGHYMITFSEYETNITLGKFVDWLTGVSDE